MRLAVLPFSATAAGRNSLGPLLFLLYACSPKEIGMRFVRAIWKLLVGIKDALVLLLSLIHI